MEFLYGTLESTPEGFVPPEMWPEYKQLSDPAPICAREEVGTNPKGIRWSLWPFTFEDYHGDAQPDMSASRQGLLARCRVITWERSSRTDTPKGWVAFTNQPSRVDGVFTLVPGEDYTRRWRKNARRDLRLFKQALAGGGYSLEPILWHEYEETYKKSLIAKRLDLARMENLKSKLAYPIARDNIELWGVRNTRNKSIVAGSAILYSPTYKSSTHFAPFILEEARGIFAATGLIDHWFSQTQARGYRYAMTLNFWFKGQPEGWKGFSEFKSHFGFTFVAYPPILYKFVAGKIF